MNIKIIRLEPESWQQYRDIRLEAVKADPQAFCVSYEEELEKTEAQWRNFINNMYFAAVDGKIIGMIGLLRDTGISGKHRAQVVSFWVKPEYRGQGAGKLLIHNLQKFVETNQIHKLYLHVTISQDNAIKLYEKLGFKKAGTLKEHIKHGDRYFDQYVMEWL